MKVFFKYNIICCIDKASEEKFKYQIGYAKYVSVGIIVKRENIIRSKGYGITGKNIEF